MLVTSSTWPAGLVEQESPLARSASYLPSDVKLTLSLLSRTSSFTQTNNEPREDYDDRCRRGNLAGRVIRTASVPAVVLGDHHDNAGTGPALCAGGLGHGMEWGHGTQRGGGPGGRTGLLAVPSAEKRLPKTATASAASDDPILFIDPVRNNHFDDTNASKSSATIGGREEYVTTGTHVRWHRKMFSIFTGECIMSWNRVEITGRSSTVNSRSDFDAKIKCELRFTEHFYDCSRRIWRQLVSSRRRHVQKGFCRFITQLLLGTGSIYSSICSPGNILL